MLSRYSRNRKSRSPGHTIRRTVSSARGSDSSARGKTSSARGSESRRSYSKMPSSNTLNKYMEQLTPKLAAIDEEYSTRLEEKRNRAKPYFEIYKLITLKLPILDSSIIDDILNIYITRESKKTPYYTRLQRIVNTHHASLKTFMHDKILLSDMKELCDSVPPSWKFKPIPEGSEIEKVKNLQDEIESLCRIKLGKRVGGSKSRKRQKKQKKRTKRRYNRKIYI